MSRWEKRPEASAESVGSRRFCSTLGRLLLNGLSNSWKFSPLIRDGLMCP